MQRFGVGHLVMVGGVCWFEGGWVFGRIGEKSIGVGDCGGGGFVLCVVFWGFWEGRLDGAGYGIDGFWGRDLEEG